MKALKSDENCLSCYRRWPAVMVQLCVALNDSPPVLPGLDLWPLLHCHWQEVAHRSWKWPTLHSQTVKTLQVKEEKSTLTGALRPDFHNPWTLDTWNVFLSTLSLLLALQAPSYFKRTSQQPRLVITLHSRKLVCHFFFFDRKLLNASASRG